MAEIIYEYAPKLIMYEVTINPLPENCWKCPFFDWGDEVCNATREDGDFDITGIAVYRAKNCPFGTNFKE